MRVCIAIIVALILVLSVRIAWAAALPSRQITIVPDTRSPVCTVVIEDVQNGRLSGTTLGDVRLFIGDHQVIPNGSGAFVTTLSPFDPRSVSQSISGDMRFVASRRGKRYYPVDSAQGQKLVPANRLYFRTEQEAKAAGFR
jgi:hypothetical protein